MKLRNIPTSSKLYFVQCSKISRNRGIIIPYLYILTLSPISPPTIVKNRTIFPTFYKKLSRPFSLHVFPPHPRLSRGYFPRLGSVPATFSVKCSGFQSFFVHDDAQPTALLDDCWNIIFCSFSYVSCTSGILLSPLLQVERYSAIFCFRVIDMYFH